MFVWQAFLSLIICSLLRYMHRRSERGVWVQGVGRLDGFHIPPSLFINSIQHGARIETLSHIDIPTWSGGLCGSSSVSLSCGRFGSYQCGIPFRYLIFASVGAEFCVGVLLDWIRDRIGYDTLFSN